MIENKEYLYEHIMLCVAKEVKKYLNESNINLLADLTDDNLDLLDSLLLKSVNTKMIVYTTEIKQFINAIESIKPISYKLKRLFNNPKNFEKFKGIIKATDKQHLARLIGAGQLILGDKGNFNWIDTSNITNMSNLFYLNYTFNGHIELWDLSNVTDMSYMFCEADDFNLSIGDWDVSSAKNMSCLFCNAKSFNQSIKDWDVSNVTDMYGMFFNAKSFNQPIGNWDVSNVENMNCLFNEAKSFNQDLSKWQINTDNIKGIFVRCPIKGKYMPTGIYKSVSESNMNLLTDLDDSDLDLLDSILTKSINNKISVYKYFPKTKLELVEIIKSEVKKNGWNCNLNHIDTSKITDMTFLFSGYEGYALGEFNGDISGWDVSNVTNMNGMFYYAKSFNQPIGGWDVSNVTNMSYMFYNAKSFNQPIGDWDVFNVTNMEGMFYGADSFNQPIGDWDVSNVTNMHSMFRSADSFNQPIGDWDVSNVENMSAMFCMAESFNQDLSNWKLKSFCNDNCLFKWCPIKDEYKP